MAMTEITFDGSIFPQVQRFQLDASVANKAHQINVPGTARTCTVYAEGAAAKLAFDTSGDTISSNYITCGADTSNEFSLADGIAVAKGIASFYVASASTGTYVSIMVEG